MIIFCIFILCILLIVNLRNLKTDYKQEKVLNDLTIEKINGEFYFFIDGMTFISQGSNFDIAAKNYYANTKKPGCFPSNNKIMYFYLGKCLTSSQMLRKVEIAK